MESAATRIPTRSRRQAMDWSLVLVSQGIVSTIDHAPDEAGWGLLVDAQNYTKALQTLRQYQIENRPWSRRQEIFLPGFLFDWSSLAWALLAVGFFWLSARTDLRGIGMMDSSAVGRGQWWRLFTAVWLHADLAHLASNVTFGFLLLGLAMGRYGTGSALLAAYLAGAGGNIAASLVATEPHHSLGASGMVMGALGMLAVQSFSLWRNTPHSSKLLVSGLCGGLMLFLMLGLGPETDIMAHFGGFISGLVLGGLLTVVCKGNDKVSARNDFVHAPTFARQAFDFACGAVFVLLTVLPWWLALTRG